MADILIYLLYTPGEVAQPATSIQLSISSFHIISGTPTKAFYVPFTNLTLEAVCSAYVFSSCSGSFPQTRNLPPSHSFLPPPLPLVQEFEKDVAEQREKLPSLQEDAEELWEEYGPGQWLRDKMAALEDMFDQLDQFCASRKGYLGR